MIKQTLSVKNAKIAFRNFSGNAGKFNPAGNRNFCVFFDEKDAKDLFADGWNIKTLKPRDPEDKEQPYLQVAVKYGDYPPRIFIITKKGKTLLSEETIALLDFAEIVKVDLVIQPSNWSVNGKTGVKAYAKQMFVILAEDDLETKYREVPDAASIPEEPDAPWNK